MGEAPASGSGNAPDTARRLAQERRIAKEGRQAERAKRAGWIAAEDVLNAGNPNDLIKVLKSGAVDCLFVDPSRWWLKPWTVPQHIWESAQFKNGKLWRNGVCLEGPHQKLIIDKRQWGEHLAGPAAPATAEGDVLQSRPSQQVEQPDIGNKNDVETPAPLPEPAEHAPTVHSELGGRPTDKDLVIGEAKRRIANASLEPLPSTQAEFVRQLHSWLDKRADAIRSKKTGKVMMPETIEGHIQPLWKAYRGNEEEGLDPVFHPFLPSISRLVIPPTNLAPCASTASDGRVRESGD